MYIVIVIIVIQFMRRALREHACGSEVGLRIRVRSEELTRDVFGLGLGLGLRLGFGFGLGLGQLTRDVFGAGIRFRGAMKTAKTQTNKRQMRVSYTNPRHSHSSPYSQACTTLAFLLTHQPRPITYQQSEWHAYCL